MTPPPPQEPGQGPVDPQPALRPPLATPQAPQQMPQQPVQPPMQQPFQGPPPGMPPMMPPPMFMPPPPPRKSGGGWIWGLVALAAVFVIGIGLLVFLVLSLGGDEPGSTVSKNLASGTRSQTVAVIPVQGVIIDSVEKQFRKDLDRARSDSNVKAVVVQISSPGGTVTDSNQMYNALLQYKAQSGVPVYIHMDDLAASGGYFLACAGDAIYCEETTITGSIGVLLQYPELSGFAEKTGIRFQTVIADGSPKKNFLDTFEQPSESDLAIAKDMLNIQYDLFAGIVQNARSQQLVAAGVTIDEVASGAVFVGPDAQAKGLVDGLGFLEDTVAAAAQAAGLTDPNVVRYERVPTLGEALGLARVPAGVQGENVKSLAVELLHEATAPKALYLYRGAQ